MPSTIQPTEPILAGLYHPSRAVMIGGEIGAELLRTVTPRILELRAQPAEPITVLIDSPGGSLIAMNQLMTLLGLHGDDDESPEIVTLATGTAASCAADLLAAGRPASAMQSAVIHFHGTRAFHTELTEEGAQYQGVELNRGNNQSALWLAQEMFPRMLDTLARVSRDPSAYDTRTPMFVDRLAAGEDPVRNRLALLAEAIHAELPEGPDEMVEEAVASFLRFQKLRAECGEPKYKPAKALLDTLKDLPPQERDRGEHRLRVVNYLLTRMVEGEADPIVDGADLAGVARYLDHYADWSEKYFQDELLLATLEHGELFFAGDELKEARRIAKEGEGNRPDTIEQFGELVGKAYRRAEPFWAFTLSIALSLQHGEHALDAESAWWLGLLDVVVGTELDRRRR